MDFGIVIPDIPVTDFGGDRDISGVGKLKDKFDLIPDIQ
jgi:hypothetical protein